METLKNEFAACEITLSYRPKIKPSERPKISCSADAYKFLLNSWNKDWLEFFEEFKIIILNRGNSVLGIVNISSGGISGTMADPKLIFGAVLKTAGSAAILAHNHPSGNLKPSRADTLLTNKLVKAGNLLEISVLDHIIVGVEGYYSFADEGAL